MNSKAQVAVIWGAFFVFAAGSSRVAYAATPAEGCSVLAPAQIEKILGQPFNRPAESKAPPVFRGQPWGAHCEYTSQKGPEVKVIFIVYVDSSPSEAKQTFDTLSVWFKPKSKPAVGDSAYIDAKDAIHILKRNVRFYISIDPSNEKQLKDVPTAMAARI